MPGIDQQVQQTVDQFRGNPQGLQKRYQQNQQLLDLLALQRLKSEKDAAARAMQMQMQNNPQTIKAQREQELLQRTKQEMAKQVGGVMQQQAQQQQQRAQAVGLGGLARPPQAGAPMPKMASGGIVALAEGGSVTDDEVFAERKKYQGISDADIDRLILKQAKGQLKAEDITPALRRAMLDRMSLVPEDVARNNISNRTAREAEKAANRAAQGQEFLAGLGYQPEPEAEGTQGLATASEPAPTMLGGQGPLRSLGQPPAAEPTVDNTPVMPQAAGEQGLATLGFGDLPSREEAIAAGRQDAAEFFDTKGEMEKYNAMIAEQEKRNAAMFDPRTERQEGLQALLAGMAGSVSNPLAAGAAGAINARAAQRSARFAREKDLMDKRTAGLDRLRELRAAEYSAGAKEGEQNVAMRTTTMEAALEQAKLEDAKLTRMAIENAGNKTRLLETQATLAQNKAKFIEDNLKGDKVLDELALRAANDPEAAQEYATAMEAKRRSLATEYDEATAESRAVIAQELERLGVPSGQPSRASGSQLDLTSLGVNPTDLAAALQRNQ